jgi:NADPH:quinone reductase-like Zn-dependent oxidoreductase
VDDSRLRPPVGVELRLADIAKAHELSGNGRAGGQIVLHVRQP